MAKKQSNLLSRKNNFYFRYYIPSALQKHFDCKELTYSLKTKEFSDAKAKVGILLVMTNSIISAVERGRLPPQKAKEIARKYFGQALERLEEQFLVAERRSIEIADGHVIDDWEAKFEGRVETAEDRSYLHLTKKLDYLMPPEIDTTLDGDEVLFFGNYIKTSKKKQIASNPEISLFHGISDQSSLHFDIRQTYEYWLKKSGLDIKPNTLSYKTFTSAIDRAVNELRNIHRQYLADEADIKIDDEWFKNHQKPEKIESSLPAVMADDDDQTKISDHFKSYLAESSVEPRTVQKKQQAFDMWIDIVGDGPTKIFTKDNARKYKEVLRSVPKNFNKKFKGKKIMDVDLKALPQGEGLNVVTINAHIGSMKTFVRWCENNTRFNGKNPFTGISLKKNKRDKDDRRIFSDSEIKSIFSSPIYSGCKTSSGEGRFTAGEKIMWDAEYWVPLIALYSGARQQEICQLYIDDIKQSSVCWFFDINQDEPDKFLKTKDSVRQIPIHPKLIRLGFLNYVNDLKAKGQKRVFPDLPDGSVGRYAQVFSKRFSRQLRKRLKIHDVDVCFHSFRHNFKDALQNAEVSRDVREALMGHKEETATAHDRYGSGIKMELLFEGLKKVKYPISVKPKKRCY